MNGHPKCKAFYSLAHLSKKVKPKRSAFFGRIIKSQEENNLPKGLNRNNFVPRQKKETTSDKKLQPIYPLILWNYLN